METPTIVTLTGMSAAGKTILQKALQDNFPFYAVVSHTTRSPRPGERHGVDYYYVDPDTLSAMHSRGELVEYIQFADREYAMAESEFVKAVEQGKIALLVCEPNGVRHIREAALERGWNVTSIFVEAPIDLTIKRFVEERLVGLPDQKAVDQEIRRLALHIGFEQRQWPEACPYEARISTGTTSADLDVAARKVYDLAMQAQPPKNDETYGSLVVDDDAVAQLETELSPWVHGYTGVTDNAISADTVYAALLDRAREQMQRQKAKHSSPSLHAPDFG